LKLQIVPLADRPDLLPVIAGWMAAEWGGGRPAALDSMRAALGERMQRAALPMAWVALLGGGAAGTVSLLRHEIESLPQYEHWLSGLYVYPPYRRRGVGEALLSHACREAGRLGIGELYLYTRNAANAAFYRARGWRVAERIVYGGREAIVMSRDIAPSATPKG
jgi:GNAT superfamily N-acetyltransferase